MSDLFLCRAAWYWYFVLNWHSMWAETVGGSPPRPASREESIQEVLAVLMAGLSPAWFMPYAPKPECVLLVDGLQRAAFRDSASAPVDWLVSEYRLDVPVKWQDEIGLTYGCPDFAFGRADRMLIVELKTERTSYRPRQMPDYLRLARHHHPSSQIDALLLGDHRPHADPPRDDRQRYAEMNWVDFVPLLAEAFSDDTTAARLSDFLTLAFTRPDQAAAGESVRAPEQPDRDDRVVTAIDQALHIAPSLQRNPNERRAQRGIDVEFASADDARRCERAIRRALAAAGYDRVSTWLWSRHSGGVPATPAGNAMGFELRLMPRRLTPRAG